jgi:organic radical activating enzyme
MTKYKVDFLDLVIIRSCQMGCEGCCTFSDHKEINGLVGVEESRESVKFWSQYIEPTRVHLFGGEPTMHPQLIDWFRLARESWPQSQPIWLNSNGYLLDKIFDHVKELFVDNISAVSVTSHTLEEPYYSNVLANYQQLQDLIQLEYQKKFNRDTFTWQSGDKGWDSDHKKFSVLVDGNGQTRSMLNITHQHSDHFVTHYQGHGINLKPWHDYNDDVAKNFNHEACHIKNYVQLYKGRLYKCPPIGVLNQTLETYNLQSTEAWDKYYSQYESLGTDATEAEIDAWFTRQKDPENVCNMCGFFGGTRMPTQQHLPKKLFKLKAS